MPNGAAQEHGHGHQFLPAMPCPVYGEPMQGRAYVPNAKGGATATSSYATCLRRCEEHGIGYSNAQQEPVKIHQDPLRNIPEQVHGEAIATLGQAINTRNRPNKLRKFAFETSEDAVTWTVFKYLHGSENLRAVLTHLGCDIAAHAQAEPTLLLWGVPVPLENPAGVAVHDALVGVSDALGERATSRSEPDVILDFADFGAVFAEVKYCSPNEFKAPDRHGWPTYLDNGGAFQSVEQVRNSGQYELTRNWRILWGLAGHRPLALINIAPAALFQGPNAAVLNAVDSALAHDATRTFHKVSWTAMRGALEAVPIPAWLSDYVDARGVQ